MANISCLVRKHRIKVVDLEEFCIDCMEEKEQRLRAQLQNCVNHLERARRKSSGSNRTYDEVINAANKTLYETLIT